MKLYHFTGIKALIGLDGVAAMGEALGEARKGMNESFNLEDFATPSSILRSGLKRGKNEVGVHGKDYDWMLCKPLPECVWLTSEPNLPPFFSTYHDWCVSVVIPETHRHLKHFNTYLSKKGKGDGEYVINFHDREGVTAEEHIQAVRNFYMYFGDIGTDCIREIAYQDARQLSVAA